MPDVQPESRSHVHRLYKGIDGDRCTQKRPQDCWCCHNQPEYTVASGPLGLLARTGRAHGPATNLMDWARANVPGKGTSYRCSLPLLLTPAPYRWSNNAMPEVVALQVTDGTILVQEPGPTPRR